MATIEQLASSKSAQGMSFTFDDLEHAISDRIKAARLKDPAKREEARAEADKEILDKAHAIKRFIDPLIEAAKESLHAAV